MFSELQMSFGGRWVKDRSSPRFITAKRKLLYIPNNGPLGYYSNEDFPMISTPKRERHLTRRDDCLYQAFHYRPNVQRCSNIIWQLAG